MSDANAEQDEVAEQQAQTNTVVVEAAEDTQGEVAKFVILTGVLLFTVLIIALLRPLIFGKIVPAVLGEGQPVAPLFTTETEAEQIKPEATELPTDDAGAEDAASESEDAALEDAGSEETVDSEDTAVSPTEAAPEPEKPEDFPTAVPAQTHTVQAGETLTAIAQRYGVTVQAIIAANDIPNPDRVAIGTQLIIPEGQ